VANSYSVLPERNLDHDVPESWCNFVYDFPDYCEPPGTNLPEIAGLDNEEIRQGVSIKPQQPLAMLRQSYNTEDATISIPEPLRELYRTFRPTPLRRAHRLEREHGLSTRVYYKYEGGNLSGSHKLNTALAQAYYYKKAGAKHLITGTGAGQWGTALAYACSLFDLKCTVFMVSVSARQKPQRPEMMRIFGAVAHESPSQLTEVGTSFLASDPDHPGSLATATSEALDLARDEDGARFAVGSGETCVLLHQTLIGLEATTQMSDLDDFPDAVVACMGAGSNFGGVALPILREARHRQRPVRLVAAEPRSCPKLTRGIYAYDINDFSGTTPLSRMYTLGSTFTAPPIHAGGLRYHGTSPFLSAMHAAGWTEAIAIPQSEALAAGKMLAEAEGLLPAPESAHAVATALRLAKDPDPERRPNSILVNISGHGLFDLSAYQTVQHGNEAEPSIDEALLAESLLACREFNSKIEAALARD
jgi:tryptophan synthase beta chain